MSSDQEQVQSKTSETLDQDPKTQENNFEEILKNLSYKTKKCPVAECGRTFSSNFVLKRHLQAIHMQLKPYQCKTCNKKFSIKQYYVEHLNTHSNERPYTCGINGCRAAFKQRSMLCTHRKNYHPEEKIDRKFKKPLGVKNKNFELHNPQLPNPHSSSLENGKYENISSNAQLNAFSDNRNLNQVIKEGATQQASLSTHFPIASQLKSQGASSQVNALTNSIDQKNHGLCNTLTQQETVGLKCQFLNNQGIQDHQRIQQALSDLNCFLKANQIDPGLPSQKSNDIKTNLSQSLEFLDLINGQKLAQGQPADKQLVHLQAGNQSQAMRPVLSNQFAQNYANDIQGGQFQAPLAFSAQQQHFSQVWPQPQLIQTNQGIFQVVQPNIGPVQARIYPSETQQNYQIVYLTPNQQSIMVKPEIAQPSNQSVHLLQPLTQVIEGQGKNTQENISAQERMIVVKHEGLPQDTLKGSQIQIQEPSSGIKSGIQMSTVPLSVPGELKPQPLRVPQTIVKPQSIYQPIRQVGGFMNQPFGFQANQMPISTQTIQNVPQNSPQHVQDLLAAYKDSLKAGFKSTQQPVTGQGQTCPSSIRPIAGQVPTIQTNQQY